MSMPSMVNISNSCKRDNSQIVEDFTNSSFYEFLNKEKECLTNEDTEADIESIFEEINRLSDNSDGRSVDEILREAELLMGNNTNVLGQKHPHNKSTDSVNNYDCFEADCCTNNVTECCNTLESLCIKDQSPNINTIINKNGNLEKSVDNEFCVTCITPVPFESEQELEYKKDLQFSKELDSKYCNKSTLTTPVNDMNNSFTVTREILLKNEIESLQEKLKDTEERLQSLRIQHDSLAQIYRVLRETHSTICEESELLKLDVQHLTECANILRNELQFARNDRDEALQVQKLLNCELNECRVEKNKAIEQNEKDSKIIQDLQRQCKEIERILMRKHPDSVSALIASKHSDKCNELKSDSRRLLEERIAQLENDAQEQDIKAQRILANVRAQFNSVQSKYETHIADLETQVLSLQEINTKLNEKIEFQLKSNEKTINKDEYICKSVQTDENVISEKAQHKICNSSAQTDSRPNSSLRLIPPKKSIPSKGSVSQSDTTASSYHTKEDTHLLTTIRGMRIDLAIKDKAMQRLTRDLEDCKKTIKKLQKEKEINKLDKQGYSNSRKQYDPAQFSEAYANQTTLKEAFNKIKILESDYKMLHDKRLQDLKALQAAHERELSSCQETIKILQQRLNERDEAFALQKRRKVPIDYYALKAKVTSLERRHSEREQRLHMLVDALSKGRFNGTIDEILAENRK